MAAQLTSYLKNRKTSIRKDIGQGAPDDKETSCWSEEAAEVKKEKKQAKKEYYNERN